VRLTDALLPSLEQHGHCIEWLDLTMCPQISTEKLDNLKLFSLVQLRLSRTLRSGVTEVEEHMHGKRYELMSVLR